MKEFNNRNFAVRMIALVFAIVLLSFAVACSSPSNNTPKENVDVKEVYNKLVATGNVPELTAVPERDLFEVYGIDVSKIKQWVFGMSENYSVHVGEIAIFEVNDPEYVSELQTKLKNHIDRTKTVAADYADPHQSEILKPVEVVAVGNFVYVVVGENYSDLLKILQDNIG